MTKELSTHAHVDIAQEFIAKLWCYVALPDGTLGIAVANERGYTPVSPFWFKSETYDEADREADRLNRKHLDLEPDIALRIITTTMRLGEAA
ncbi:MAG: hypothetical protein KDJ69_12115 [Nitratireductor sp.]|nr:hypothetical protein [Nitratireductor sp.]